MHLGALNVAVASSNDFFLLKMGGACMFNLRHPHAQCVHPPSIAKRLNFQAIWMQRAIIVQRKILSAAPKRAREPERALLLVFFLGLANVCALCSTRGKGAGCLLRQKWGTWRHTGWRRLIGSPKLQIIFHKRATKYRSLLRKMTYKDKGSYESSPPCNMPALDFMS